MKQIIIIFLALIFIVNMSSAQLDLDRFSFADKIIVGGSFTYLRYTEETNETKFHELVSNINVSTNVFDDFYVGLSYLDIRTRYTNIITTEPIKDNYYMAGAFFQYDFLGDSKHRLLGELSYHYGNYCNCGKEDPYKSENLSYFGFGGSYDHHLIKGLYLDIGFNVYTILNKRERKDIFAQYIIGLNYHFDIRK